MELKVSFTVFLREILGNQYMFFNEMDSYRKTAVSPFSSHTEDTYTVYLFSSIASAV